MRNRSFPTSLALMAIAWVAAGCIETKNPIVYVGHANLEHYKDVATSIEYADSNEPLNDAISQSQPPRRIGDLEKDEIWDLPLAEAIQIALKNNEIIRRNGGVVEAPEVVPSAYDPAIQETEPLFGVGNSGTRGIEAALSDFDTTFSTNMLWGRNSSYQNNRFLSGGFTQFTPIATETGTFSSSLEKTFASSGRFTLRHDWNYSLDDLPLNSRLFGSSYSGFVRAEYRQPLLAGSGTEFTRIAGPIDQNVGLDRGVVIARINSDISVGEFERAVQDMLKEVEDVYWDLFLSYQIFHNETIARDSAERNWQRVKIGLTVGRTQKSAEAQARANYFEARSRTENALADIYANETRLRRLLGLPINEGKVIRPMDDPLEGEFTPDWHVALAEALTTRVELRQQKWKIKKLELQLRAAENLARPRLDMVSNYQVNGFGDQLFGVNDKDGNTSQGLRSAYETITQGEQTGWNLGFEFTWDLGFRSQLSTVRNVELRLAKSRAYLAAKELDIGHELAQSFQQAARSFTTARSHWNRMIAAQEQVDLIEEESRLRETTPEAIDLLLRAHMTLRDARLAYYASIIDYNKAMTDIEYRKGTLLKYDNVHLAEDLWEPGAYEEALRRAWARSFAIPAHHVHAEPEHIVSPGYESIELRVPDGYVAPGLPEDRTQPMAPLPQPVDENSDPALLPVPPVATEENDLPPGS